MNTESEPTSPSIGKAKMTKKTERNIRPVTRKGEAVTMIGEGKREVAERQTAGEEGGMTVGEEVGKSMINGEVAEMRDGVRERDQGQVAVEEGEMSGGIGMEKRERKTEEIVGIMSPITEGEGVVATEIGARGTEDQTTSGTKKIRETPGDQAGIGTGMVKEAAATGTEMMVEEGAEGVVVAGLESTRQRGESQREREITRTDMKERAKMKG